MYGKNGANYGAVIELLLRLCSSGELTFHEECVAWLKSQKTTTLFQQWYATLSGLQKARADEILQ